MPIVSAAGGQQVARRVCGVLAPSMTLRSECQKDGSIRSSWMQWAQWRSMEHGLGCDHVVFSHRDVLPVCSDALPVSRNGMPVSRNIVACISQHRCPYVVTRCPHVVLSCPCRASPLPVCRDGLPAERHGAALKARGQVQAYQAAPPGWLLSVPARR